MRITQYIYPILALTFLLTFSTLSQAGLAGKVIMVSGQAFAINAEGQERVLQRRSDIHEQDTIITTENSHLQIRFIDNGLFALQPSSRFSVHQYRVAQEASADSKVLMELIEGGFRSLTGSIGKGTPEAYKISTPAASIGIRGTLYSIRIDGDALLAGVWQGGIRLTTKDGEGYNLGLDSPYQFGKIDSNGFTGLLEAPSILDMPAANGSGQNENTDDQSTASETNNNSVSTDPADASIAPEDTSTASNPIAINTDNASQQADISELSAANINDFIVNAKPGINPDTTSTVLSATEQKIFDNNSGELAYTTDGATALAGQVFTNEKGEHVFVSRLNDGSYYVLRYDGSSTNPLLGSSGINSYVWNEQPNSHHGPVSDNALEQFWYYQVDALTAAQQLGNNDTSYHFNIYSPMQGTDSAGNELVSSDGQFTLNLSNGAISNGFISAHYGDETNGSQWSLQFKGNWGNGNAQTQLQLLNGSLVLVTSGVTAHGEVNIDKSFLNSVFYQQDDRYWALVLSQLSGTVDGKDFWASYLALGLGAQLQVPDSIPLSATEYGNYSYAKLIGGKESIAVIGDQLLQGQEFMGSNGQRVFYDPVQNSVYRLNGHASTLPDSGWGIWDNSATGNNIQDHNQSSIDAALAWAQIERFVLNGADSKENMDFEFNFTTAGNHYFGEDSLGNSLTAVSGPLSLNLSSGKISITDVSLTYSGNGNGYLEPTFSIFGTSDAGLTIDFGIDNSAISPDGTPSGQFNFIPTGKGPTPTGAISQHVINGKINGTDAYWANGIIMWQPTK